MYRLAGLPKVHLRSISAWISTWLSLIPAAALAQASVCHVPDRIEPVTAAQPPGEDRVITPVRGYTLALSWSPEFCRSHADDSQCSPVSGRFGFILHGLWPEGAGRAYPQWCAPPLSLPPAVVRAQFCVTPSPRLIAHEWAKHGMCASSDPVDYFGAARTLFGKVHFPDMNALSRRPLDTGAFKRAFAAVNPPIPPSAMIVESDRKGGWLREVHICLTAAMKPEPCPRFRPQGAPDGAPIKIWRGG